MNQAITMPALSDTMNNGRLIRWAKKIGDPIKKGESIADVETDKAVMDVEAFHDGYLAGPLAAEGSELPVGATIGYIADNPGGGMAAPSATPSPTGTASAQSGISGQMSTPPAPSPPPGLSAARSVEAARDGVRASPYARRLAQELGVDITRLTSEHGDVHAEAILNAVRRTTAPDLATGPPIALSAYPACAKPSRRT